jgi:supervillin
MVVRLGRRGDSESWVRPRLFVVRGEVGEEAHCVEVDCSVDSLRSRGCFLYVESAKTIRLWIGHGSPEHARKIGKMAADHFRSTVLPAAVVVEESEGSESEALKKWIGSASGYDSMVRAVSDPNRSTRLFFMSSVSGDFQVKEVACPFLCQDVANLMPFNQSDLYAAEQPGS